MSLLLGHGGSIIARANITLSAQNRVEKNVWFTDRGI